MTETNAKRRALKCKRCGYEWMSATRPAKCASSACRSEYWNRPRRSELEAQAEAKRAKSREFDILEVIEQEKRALEARRLAKEAGLSVSDWLNGLPEAQREEWSGVSDLLAIWERVHREMRERGAWERAVDEAKKWRGNQQVFTYHFMRVAEKNLKEMGIPLDDQRAVEHVFELAGAANPANATLW